MRLIDATALERKVIEWMPSDPCGREEKERPFETDIVVSLMMEIEEAPTIDINRPHGEWVPVSERLPSEDGKYLVFYEGTIIGSDIDIMWYGEPLMPNVDVGGKHFYRSDGEWGDVVYDEALAWMPLPEPYREVEE